MDHTSGTTIPLSNLAEDWYCQCWSLNEQTDAKWRIYSPDPKKATGLKMRMTIRRFVENLQGAGSSVPYLQFFIGRVVYHRQEEIEALIAAAPLTPVTSLKARQSAI